MADACPGYLARRSVWQLAIVAGCAGGLSVLAFAPFYAWPLLFITFPVMIWLLDAVFANPDRALSRRKQLRNGAFVGWSFGYGFFLFGIYWIGYSFMANEEQYSVLAMVAAVLALPAGLALFYALAALFAGLFWRRGYGRIVVFIFAFFAAEAARGHILTGFPWDLFGQALAGNDALMQLAAYIGIYGLTLIALFVFTCPAAWISGDFARYKRQAIPVLVAVFILAGGVYWGGERLRLAPFAEVDGVRVRIVQPNIPQRDKWNREKRNSNFERILSLSRFGTSGEDISAFTHVVWPESSVPFLFMGNGEIFLPDVKSVLSGLIPAGTNLIIGAERAENLVKVNDRLSSDRVFNSLFVLSSQANIDAIYDKVHLVPFGEYVPLSEFFKRLGVGALSHQNDGFIDGAKSQVAIKTLHGPAFAPLICYEIVFSSAVINEQDRPGWMINLTNDAWFGESTGPYQHLHQARVRAVEEGLPIVRAANTGISAVIDPFGRVISQLDLGKAGVIDHVLPQALPITFFGKFSKLIFIALFLFPILIYLAIVVADGRRMSWKER